MLFSVYKLEHTEQLIQAVIILLDVQVFATMTDKVISSWYVYMIEASNGSLYTGVATNVERRFDEHAAGRGAKYFNASRRPVRVVYTEAAADRSTAQIREAAIKGLSRHEKLFLVKGKNGNVNESDI